MIYNQMRNRRKIELGQFMNDCECFQHSLHVDSMRSEEFRRQKVNGKSFTNFQELTFNEGTQLRLKSLKNNMVEVNDYYSKDFCRQNSNHSESHSLNLKELSKDLQQIALTSGQTNKKVPHVKKNELNFKEIISKQKVKAICQKFIEKSNRNNTKSQPVHYVGFSQQDKSSFWQLQGFQPSNWVSNTMNLLNIILVLTLFIVQSIELVFFEEFNQHLFAQYLKLTSLIYFIIEVVFYSITITSRAGRKLKTLAEIIQCYYQEYMLIDILNILIIAVGIGVQERIIDFIGLFVVTKLPQCLEKLERLEVVFIKNYHNEQYWSLVKVVLFNFCFAHVLAVFLSAMARLDPHNNWHSAKGISSAGWLPKYIWAYYWGVNIMLTVGFGDLVATTHQEALCLVFIEIVSVMCLAYNISWIGTLISNIRAQDLERGKNFKTFQQLSGKYDLSSELEWRISNYIEQSVNIRKKFNMEEERAFISSLPNSMQKDYKKQANKIVFQQLPFFNSLLSKTLYSLAQKVEMSITHPEQLIRKIDDGLNMLILRQGEIGYTVKQRNCNYNGMVIDSVKVDSNDKPFILGLEFLTKTRPIYEIKSLEYSIIYSLPYDELLSILKQSSMDYNLFCFLRDKSSTTIDQFQVLDCKQCKKGKKHTKFTCPKLHFVPLQQIVIYKQISKQKKYSNKRNPNKLLRTIPDKVQSLRFKNHLKTMINKSSSQLMKSKVESKKDTNSLFNNKLMEYKMQRQLDRIGDSNEQAMKFDRIIKNTSDVIKQQINRLLRLDSHQDDVWIIESDKIKNYKEYFPQGNACNIEISLSTKGRKNSLKSLKLSKDKVSQSLGSRQFPIHKSSETSKQSCSVDI